jgi:SlyX protein
LLARELRNLRDQVQSGQPQEFRSLRDEIPPHY